MIEAKSADDLAETYCDGCAGTKGAPIAVVLRVLAALPPTSRLVELVLCQECGRDAANAIGLMCVRDGGWSKLEPRKRRPKR